MELVISKHIEINPEVCFGKPRIAGTRMSVEAIATMYLKQGQSVEEIAGKYDLSLASVHAAMSYYYEHREEIEQRIAEGDAFVEEFKRNHPSPLEEKRRRQQ